MKLIRGIHNLTKALSGCVITIGNFDGIHLGHQKVLAQLKEKAKQLNLPSLVITFEPLPQEYFLKHGAPARLLCLREKLMLLAEHEIDYVLCLYFTAELETTTAESFVKEILIKKLNTKAIIIGDDFQFGYQRKGNFALLQELGKSYDFTVENTDTILYDGQRIGSSRVRVALAESNFTLAEALLGRTYSISGRVIHGSKRGRKFNCPTANIAMHRRVNPLQGVFIVQVHGLGTEALPGVANIGPRPAIDNKTDLLEVHVLGIKYDFYSHYLTVDILHKIRDGQYFSCLEDLKTQMQKDIEATQKYFLQRKP